MVKWYTLAVVDESGFTLVQALSNAMDRVRNVREGDKVKLGGYVARNPDGNKYPFLRDIEIVGHGKVPTPMPATPKDIMSLEFSMRVVSLRGFIADVFRDEIDPRFTFLVLSDGSSSAFLTLRDDVETKLPSYLVGATVEVVGIVNNPPANILNRKIQNVTVSIKSLDSIKVITKPPHDPFDVPSLYNIDAGTSGYLNAGLRRRKATGRVIAVWRDKALLKTTDELVARVQFAERPYPRRGDEIEAVGIPDTDFFRLNLSRAIWRKTDTKVDIDEDPPETIGAEALLTDGKGNTKISAEHYGKLVTVSGILSAKPSMRIKDMRAELACGDLRLALDITSNPNLLDHVETGSTIEATGICVIEAETWRPQTPYPHIQELFISVSSADDIRVVKGPAWWTPFRLMVVVALMGGVLVLVLVWNAALRVLVERRSREVIRAQERKMESELRIGERTRLAADLHDSISQNLTVIGYQVSTARNTLGEKDPATADCLDTAAKMIRSCRTDLRRCLWDLRNDVLDEPSFAEAIRKTVEPVAEDASVAVRFSGPRSTISDATAHAVLNVVRELVANAVRHGKAKSVQIAGVVDSKGLEVSVHDDGCGFDVKARPRQEDGHFGLDGIIERLERIGGTFEIESTPGKSTCARIRIARTEERA